MRIWKAQTCDGELLKEFCIRANTQIGSEMDFDNIQKNLTHPEDSLVGIYLIAAEEKPLIGIWIQPVRKTVAIRRVITTLVEDTEEFAHYLHQFFAMLLFRLRANGENSLFCYTGSEYVMKVALAAGFELYSELLRYCTQNLKLSPVENSLPVQIRLFQREDLDGLVAVEQQIFMPEVWNDRDSFNKMAEHAKSRFFVATILDQVVGYLYLIITKKGYGQVVQLGVHEDYQRFGIGKLLLYTGLQWLDDNGIHEVILYVSRDNLLARLMFEKFGFNEEDMEYLLWYCEGGI